MNLPGKVDRAVVQVAVGLRSVMSDRAFCLLLAALIGAVSGCGAWLLKHTVGWTSRVLTHGLHAAGPDLLLLALPVTGIVITGCVCRYVMHCNLAHGVRHLKQQLGSGNGRIPLRGVLNPIVASTITLGFGGSAGSEGPIACTGAAVGSNFARYSGLGAGLIVVMVGCGAGAGIAGIFKAPLAGVLFTLEVLGIALTTFNVLLLVVACLLAATVAYALGGFSVDVAMTDISGFDPSILGWVCALGVWCGLYSIYYSYIMKRVEVWLDGVKNHWVKWLLAGLSISLMVFVFPSLYGEGYDVVGAIINGHPEALLTDSPWGDNSSPLVLCAVATGVLACKCFACSATNSGGGVAGDFAPTLMAGSVAGFLFVSLAGMLPGVELPATQMSYFALAGVMAGAIRAPLMAIFLVMEMTGAYQLLIPIAVTAFISFLIVRAVTSDDFFRHGVDRHNGYLAKLNSVAKGRK